MSKEFMKVYHMPFKTQEIKDDNFTNFTLQFEQAFEEMTKSFSKQKDEIIINYLYEKYKDTKVSDVWVLSKPDFEKFLLEMLPKWKEPKQYVDELKLVEKKLHRLESIDNAEPSEALECLEKLTLLTCNIEWYKDNINIIKQALIKAEKEHKALEIIKEKNVNVYYFKSELTLRNISYRYYVNNFGGFHNGLVIKLLDEEEFNLLKEVLGC